MSEAREVVLPSGRFVNVRPILWGDLLVAFKRAGNDQMMVITVLAELCATIDGQPVSVDECARMEAQEFMPIMTLINDALSDVSLFKRGVA